MTSACRLECGHSLVWFPTYLPKIGDHVWCARCEDMKRVSEREDSWVAACDSCTFRKVAQQPDTIARHVTRHLDAYPSHVVHVRSNADGTAVTVSNRGTTTPGNLFGEEPDTLFDTLDNGTDRA